MEKGNQNYFENIKKDFLRSDDSVFKFGSIGDGGYYLRPNTIRNSKVLFSGGISSNVEFEETLYNFNEKLQIIMVDPTVSGSKLLAKGIGRLFFSKPEKMRYLSNVFGFIHLKKSDRCFHLKTWLNKEQSIIKIVHDYCNLDTGILLKLDIEGSEYDFLEEIIQNLDAFNAMVFEFHDLHENHEVVYKFIEDCSPLFNLVHLSENPSGGYDSHRRPKNIEISLERRLLI